MARPIKQGLDYFPLDSQFLNDMKVRKIMRAQGTNAIAVLISLLCNIYRDKGYYILRDDDVSFLISDEVGVKEEYVNEVIEKAIQVGFFDPGKYEKYNILTSNGIQKRFIEATERRKEIIFNEEFRVNANNNPNNDNINPNNGYRSTQSKVKESKVKESKVKESKEDEVAFSSSATQKILLSKPISIEHWAMANKITPVQVQEKINEFAQFKERHSENVWKNESDLTKNFEYWLRSNALPKIVKPQIQKNGNFQKARRR